MNESTRRALDELARIAAMDDDLDTRDAAGQLVELLRGLTVMVRRAEATAERRQAAADLADRLIARFDTDWSPPDLAVLRHLPEDGFGRLLTRLVAKLVEEERSGPDVESAVEQVDAVVRAWHVDGAPTVLADLPDVVREWTPTRRMWATAAALTFVDPAQVVAALLPRLPDDPAARRAVLLTVRDLVGRVDLAPADRFDVRLSGVIELLQSRGRLVPRTTDAEGWLTGPAGADLRPVGGDHPRGRGPDDAGRTGAWPYDGDAYLDDHAAGLDEDFEEAGSPRAWSPGGSVADRGRPGRTAYPLLAAPDEVAAGVVFDLRVGLAGAEQHGVVAPEPLSLPGGDVDVSVSLYLGGFRVVGNVGPAFTLRVRRDDPYPVETLRIAALDDATLPDVRTIQASFDIDRRLIGVAYRPVRVLAGGWATNAVAAVAQSAGAPNGGAGRPGGTVTAWSLDPDPERPVDLALVVTTTNTRSRDTLRWLILSAHPAVGRIEVERAIGAGTADWARSQYRIIEGRGTDLGLFLRDLGRTVAGAVPAEVWAAVRATSGAGSRTPSVLLATDEPFIPWELAQLPEEWGVEDCDVLGGYAAVGRWIIDVGRNQSRMPPATIDAATMSAVSGTYQKNDLPSAREEAAQLVCDYAARPVEATKDDVVAMLRAVPGHDIVHFAIHGVFDQFGTRDGMLLADGSSLSAAEIGGLPRFRGRIVFLNACQLGRATEALGRTAGMVAAFLGLGAQAVVAPLWKVDDAQARAVGTEFYRAVLAGGSPADFFRQQRQAARGREGEPIGTRLAYLYFGHPRLRVDWRGAVPPDVPLRESNP